MTRMQKGVHELVSQAVENTEGAKTDESWETEA